MKFTRVLFAGFIAVSVFVFDAGAQFFYDESCRNATGSFQYYGSAVGYTAGMASNPDPGDNGWLRLTDTDSTSQLGYVTLDRTFPSTMGVTVEFDFKTWNDKSTSIADGFSVFLFDGDPAKTFKIGDSGGYLGYWNMTPAYLGVGIDEYGNFSNSTLEWNGGANGAVQHSIAIRKADYGYVKGTATQLGSNTTLAYTSITPSRPADNVFYRRVRIEMEPITGGMSVTVQLKTTTSGAYITVLDPVNVMQPTPARLGLGFAGATGAYMAFHEVRDVIIRTPGDMSVFKSTDDCATLDHVTIHTVIANNTNVSALGIAVIDTLPAGFVLAGSEPVVTSGTMHDFSTDTLVNDGRIRCTYTIDAPGNSAVRIIYSGSFAVPPADEQYSSGGGITPPSGFNDVNTNDNHAIVTGMIQILSADRTDFVLTGDPVTLNVTATNSAEVASYAWEQSDDNGATWPSTLSSTTASHTHAGNTYALVRCIAQWNTGCRDTVVFRLYKAPDNIYDADCFEKPPAQVWDIREATALGTASTYAPPLVGDLDGDGRPEIVLPYEHGTIVTAAPVGLNSGHRAQKIKIYKNQGEGAFMETVFQTDQPYTPLMTGCMALARVRIDGRDSAIIVVAEADLRLRAYNYNGVRVWTSTDTWRSGGTAVSETSVGIADFNADGQAEIYTGNRIFDAATGTFLCAGTGNEGEGKDGNSSYAYHVMTVAADLFGTGKLNLVAGSQVYEVADDLSSMTVVRNVVSKCTANSPVMLNNGDGLSQVIDIDNDGKLEVLVEGRTSNSSAGVIVYLWSPEKQEILAQANFPSSTVIGIPFIGDIDGDRKPVLLFITNEYIYAYRYVAGNPLLQEFWKLKHDDGSAMTGLTLFDFNQDDTTEIVYRDEKQLRIINGSSAASATGPPLKTYPCYSGTGYEYPVVADIDGDGSAEILIGGASSAGGTNGPLRIFKAGGDTKWAPARKVWNQYAYNVVNVNEDLTIPAVPLNPAAVFPGPNGLLGDGDDIRPYNAFLQQQTSLNAKGAPLWLTPNLTPVSAVYDYDSDGDSLCITVKLTNTGDAAALSPVYLSVYRNTVSVDSLMTVDSIGTVGVGDTVAVITVRNYSRYLPLDTVVISLNDRGDGRFVQTECDTTDSRYRDPESNVLGVFNDVATVQAYRYVEINLLANDRLPAGFLPDTFHLLESVPKPPELYSPRNGILVRGNSPGTLVYLNTGIDSVMSSHIDSFRYTVTFYNDALGETQTGHATAYIYILVDRHGASACFGDRHPYTATLDAVPGGTDFRWYTGTSPTDTVYRQSGASYTFGAMTGSDTLMVKPVSVTAGASPWNRTKEGFPPGEFTVHAPADATPVSMRWTGLENTDWHNPANWVEVHTAYEIPVVWSPSRCTDVVISSEAPYYPELVDSAYCAVITVEDRAMLANPHVLDYDSARVELLLRPTERDRFVMWSAPLKDMYSGDYHFKSADLPRWGDVAMNYFQLANPSPGSSMLKRADMFTATFGEPGETLPLGKAFNVKVTATSASRNAPLLFPQKETEYVYTKGQTQHSVPLTRNVSHRFITDSVELTGGRFDLPVMNSTDGGQMVQIVNPYLAWLRIGDFLDNNSDSLETAGYLTWDGRESNTFICVKRMDGGDDGYSDGMRYRVKILSNFPSYSPGELLYYIPPLQSFFAVKKNGVSSVSAVKMSPGWTGTATTEEYSGGYQLRAGEADSGVLRIRAVQGSGESYAALHFDRYVAVPEYSGREDVRALFYDANPLTVYVLTPLGEPLAISADGEYESHVTPLGLRIAESGEVTLEFTGQEHFGHDVYLIDRERNLEIDLQQTPSYTFTAVRPSVVPALELNDRFALRMVYTGTGLANGPAPAAPSWTVIPLNGEIHVRALSGIIRSLQVYSVAGTLIYATQTAGDYFRIPVEHGGVYLIRANINGAVETKKTGVND
jgi:hypothetical protein